MLDNMSIGCDGVRAQVYRLFTFRQLLVLSSDTGRRCFRLIPAGRGADDLRRRWRATPVWRRRAAGGRAGVGRMSTRACHDAPHGTARPLHLTRCPPRSSPDTADKEVTARSDELRCRGRQTAAAPGARLGYNWCVTNDRHTPISLSLSLSLSLRSYDHCPLFSVSAPRGSAQRRNQTAKCLLILLVAIHFPGICSLCIYSALFRTPPLPRLRRPQ